MLDVPCGAGRLQAFSLALGHQIVWADGALSMVRQACADTTAAPPSVQTSALQLGFADRSFDGVLQFRFLHHLPRHKAKTAVAEARRVAQRFVVVSVFHPCSLHHLQRRLRELLLDERPLAMPPRCVNCSVGFLSMALSCTRTAPTCHF